MSGLKTVSSRSRRVEQITSHSPKLFPIRELFEHAVIELEMPRGSAGGNEGCSKSREIVERI